MNPFSNYIGTMLDCPTVLKTGRLVSKCWICTSYSIWWRNISCKSLHNRTLKSLKKTRIIKPRTEKCQMNVDNSNQLRLESVDQVWFFLQIQTDNIYLGLTILPLFILKIIWKNFFVEKGIYTLGCNNVVLEKWKRKKPNRNVKCKVLTKSSKCKCQVYSWNWDVRQLFFLCCLNWNDWR